MRKHLPDPTRFIGLTLPHAPNFEIKDHVGSGNNGHVFRAYSEAAGHELACKIVPSENLPQDEKDQDLWLQETKKSNQVHHAAVVHCVDVGVWRRTDWADAYVVFLYEYVPGRPLRRYVRDLAKGELTIPFIEAFLQTMLGLLHELKGRHIEHGDLHAGNVIVADPSELDIEPRLSFRVIDFGVREMTVVGAGRRDALGVAQMLRDLLEKVDYRICRPRDKYVYDILRRDFLRRYLIETDPLADAASSPKAMYDRLQRIDSEYAERQAPEQSVRMLTPFDYPNCEQMDHSHLLLSSLYSDRFLGLREIEARNNLVLTGPRGCGKTTVFRALSLQHRVRVDTDGPGDVAYIGVYYRCDDLYFAFPRYAKPERPEAVDVPMHFVVVTLLAALLDVLGDWSRRHFAEEFAKREARMVARLWEVLGWDGPDDPMVSRLEAITSRLQRERRRAAKKWRVAHDPKHGFGVYFGPEKLLEAWEAIREECGYVDSRPVYFFVDDYSEPKITQELQDNLNRLFMHRCAGCFFKLSTESPVSFATRDMDGKAFVEAREYTLVNLGLRYIKAGGRGTLAFLEDLFERRFAEVRDYPVRTLEDLIGTAQRNENAIARNMRSSKPARTYFGKETLAALCSGDIHYMIRLVERMVEECQGENGLREIADRPKISARRQQEVIRAAAGEFLVSVRMLPGLGSRLADVVTAFGNVARSYLLHRTSKNEGDRPPHQASRIEPYESLALGEEAEQVRRTLLRYSIFLEDPRGKSRRGQVVSRLYLRRYLIPHFNLTFSQRDSIELENREVELLFGDPRRFEETKRIRGGGDEGTRDLFVERAREGD